MNDPSLDVDEPAAPSRMRKLGLGAIIAVVIIIVVGFVGQLSGSGWFGYRSTLYGSGELYALNMGNTPLWVSVDGRPRVEVPVQNAELVEIMGGESEVLVTDQAGEIKGRYEIFTDNSHAFLKLTDEGCLAVTKLDPFYKGGGKQDIVITKQLDNAARVWVPESKNVVWPRKVFPKRLAGGDGPGLWVELVGCSLLGEPKFLDAYLALRLEERVKKAKGGDKKGK